MSTRTRPPGLTHATADRSPTGTTRLRTAGDDMGPWSPSASCARTDPELFFPVGPGRFSQAQTERAKAVCANCPVLESCRDWALTYPKLAEYGVWGGLAEDERRVLVGMAARRLRHQGVRVLRPADRQTHAARTPGVR